MGVSYKALKRGGAMTRWRDWWNQAEADLRHSKIALDSGSYEWACFACQQAAEKALKAVFEKSGDKVWGHSVLRLMETLGDRFSIPEELIVCAKMLDKHYIPTRYPDGLVEGCPAEFYTKEEAIRAIGCAEKIIGFCDGLLTG